jgi:cbb3-type cytochrome oxidase subunit 1
MKPRDIAIAVVWMVVLAIAFHNGIGIGHVHNPPPPIHIWIIAPPLFFIFVSIVVFRSRHRPMGAGTSREFLERLRPAALFMVALLIIGVVGLASTYANGQSSSAYLGSAFFLSCGLGFLLAYVLSFRFPPRLY